MIAVGPSRVAGWAGLPNKRAFQCVYSGALMQTLISCFYSGTVHRLRRSVLSL